MISISRPSGSLRVAARRCGDALSLGSGCSSSIGAPCSPGRQRGVKSRGKCVDRALRRICRQAGNARWCSPGTRRGRYEQCAPQSSSRQPSGEGEGRHCGVRRRRGSHAHLPCLGLDEHRSGVHSAGRRRSADRRSRLPGIDQSGARRPRAGAAPGQCRASCDRSTMVCADGELGDALAQPATREPTPERLEHCGRERRRRPRRARHRAGVHQ